MFIISLLLFLVVFLLNVHTFNQFSGYYVGLPKWVRIILFIPPFAIITNLGIMVSALILYIIESFKNI